MTYRCSGGRGTSRVGYRGIVGVGLRLGYVGIVGGEVKRGYVLEI